MMQVQENNNNEIETTKLELETSKNDFKKIFNLFKSMNSEIHITNDFNELIFYAYSKDNCSYFEIKLNMNYFDRLDVKNIDCRINDKNYNKIFSKANMKDIVTMKQTSTNNLNIEIDKKTVKTDFNINIISNDRLYDRYNYQINHTAKLYINFKQFLDALKLIEDNKDDIIEIDVKNGLLTLMNTSTNTMTAIENDEITGNAISYYNMTYLKRLTKLKGIFKNTYISLSNNYLFELENIDNETVNIKYCIANYLEKEE